MSAVSFIFIQGLIEDYSLGDSFSIVLRKLLQGSKGEANLFTYICISLELARWLKEPTCNAGDAGDTSSIPESGRFPGGGHGNPLQYTCLENPMDKGSWWTPVHWVTKNQT